VQKLFGASIDSDNAFLAGCNTKENGQIPLRKTHRKARLRKSRVKLPE